MGSSPIIRSMGRRSIQWRQVNSLEDERKLGQLAAIEQQGRKAFPDASLFFPGTEPEKMVFEYLRRLKVNFQFQYHQQDFESTAFPEDIYQPDFILPDYNITIEIYGTYWHELAERKAADEIKQARNLYAGNAVIQYGIQQNPVGGGYNGKYIVWWDSEIYRDLPFLFIRDLPELFSEDRIKGEFAPYLEDREAVIERKRKTTAALAAGRMRPKIHPYQRQIKKLRNRMLDIEKIYPILRKVKEDVTPQRIPRGLLETRGRKKT